ncbi:MULTISPECIES: hypothetical protein [Tenacibaculum]|uniref:hypothetical protein n=1 Tax=Tenacibaculum TaxID=104267 RepID=UPI001F0A4AE9|nr:MULTISPECIES: hypothetical protein [Tenacibaculum]MCH3881315.1 hypothetical protein [Tenacibaculum aquimarinum]MDO6599091.1 hypothetical protein [Tenacibaculum sp. 1_MG-2023]
MNWCILIPLLVGLISAILGYLLGKLLSGGENNDDSNARIASLEADLNACKASKTRLESDLSSAKSSLSSGSGTANMASSFAGAAATAIAFDAAAAKAAFGKKVKENDLTVVEGIGPKIQELFHNFDVKTWAGLGSTSVEKCQEVLESGGARFKMHNPKTWPKQAGLAAAGKWQELKDWQDALDGGR